MFVINTSYKIWTYIIFCSRRQARLIGQLSEVFLQSWIYFFPKWTELTFWLKDYIPHILMHHEGTP